MSAPTNVMMNKNTSDKASTLRLKAIDKFPVLIHSHKVCKKTPPDGGSFKNRMPITIVTIAARHISPAPIHAMAFLDKCLPARDRTRKPAKGNAGIKYKYCCIQNFKRR